jgi:preprotein translocase subunit SecY
MEMLKSLRSAFALPDLRNRILFVMGMLAVYVFGIWIPIDPELSKAAQSLKGGLFDMIDIFVGGALKRFSIFAMGIMPYITASIVFQVLAIALPAIQHLQKEGEFGRRKISQYTRWLTMGLVLVQGFMVVYAFKTQGLIPNMSPFHILRAVFTLMAGTAFLMWLGEQITEKGIGNGISFLIFAGIVARLPQELWQIFELARQGSVAWFNVIILIAFAIGTVVAIVTVTQGERRIPVRYADRMAGRRGGVIRGVRTHLPLRMAQAGVMPIIFAVTVVMLPAQIFQFAQPMLQGREFWGLDLALWGSRVANFFTPGESHFAAFIYAALVMVFTYFYTAVVLDVRELADNLKKQGGQIQGFAPGLPTAQYIDRVLTRITFAGGLFLALVALSQYYIPGWAGFSAVRFSLIGGTSVLIVVGVALETMNQLEQQLKLRQYEKFKF